MTERLLSLIKAVLKLVVLAQTMMAGLSCSLEAQSLVLDSKRTLLLHVLRQAHNNDIDLGENGNAFEDLYLSGGVYLGGTGSANKLDDYEEGTTPVVHNATTTTYTTQTGYYRKVGDLVFV